MLTSRCNDNITLAERYYALMLNKDFDGMEKCLDPSVQFIGPLAEMTGRDAVVEAAKNLMQVLKTITIRSKFAADNEIMLAYDFLFAEPIGNLRAAVLMECKEGAIVKIELFYDARAFEMKKGEIFQR